jgi:pimeloyl-ACP methyl ester carboxylesterase
MSRLDYPAMAIDLPGRGRHPAPLDEVHIRDFVDSAVHDIRRAGVSDIVLVGHSMAGLSLPGIVAELPGLVRHVVLVSAVILAPGATLIDLVAEEQRDEVRRLQPSREGVLLPDEVTIAMQCYDMDESQTRFTLDVVVPEAYWPTREPPDVCEFDPSVERTWIRLTRDQTFTPDVQDVMSARAKCERAVDIDSGHMAMISHPAELARVLNALHHDHV